MSKKVFVVLSLVFVLVLLSVVAVSAQDPVKIGVVDSFTGAHSAYGIGTLDGYNLAKKYRPEVLGRPIEFIIVDTKSDKQESSLAASRAIADGSVALLGTASSGFTIAVVDVAKEKGIPVVTSFSTNPMVTQDNDIAFRSCFIDPYQGWALAKFATEDLGAKTAVLLYDVAADYNVGIANFFRSSWNEMTGDPKTILAELKLMNGDTDFSAQLTQIKELQPEVVVIPNDYKEVGLILKQARELGLTMPFLAADAADLPETVEIAGNAVNGGFYFTSHWEAAAFDNEIANNFGNYYREEYNRDPDSTAAVAWDAYNLLVDAIERAGKDDPALIRDELANTADYEGVSGKIAIDDNGDAIKSVVVLTFENNERKLIKVIEP